MEVAGRAWMQPVVGQVWRSGRLMVYLAKPATKSARAEFVAMLTPENGGNGGEFLREIGGIKRIRRFFNAEHAMTAAVRAWGHVA